MRRTVLTLFAILVLCAWVSAQGAPPLTAEIQVKQFKNNRILIENLVDHGIYISNADDSLARAEACQRTARTLANYLERAAGDGDPDRVAEFAGLFSQVVREGLIPNLDAAKRSITDPKSKGAEKLKEVKGGVRSNLEGVLKAIASDGKLGDNGKVKSAVAVIEELAGKFGTP